MARRRIAPRAPSSVTGWTALPFDVRLGPRLPEPGIGGIIGRAAIPVDPACPAAYCYQIAIEGADALGRPLGRSWFSFATATQIRATDLVAVVEALAPIPALGQRELYRRDTGQLGTVEPAVTTVTIYSVTRRA